MSPPTLSAVERAVVSCRRCPRLRAHCTQVAREKKRAYRDWEYWGRPVPGFGDPGARLLIVGLAPAAHGANRTGRMFTGDSSGDWLYGALHRQGFASQPSATSRDDGLTLTDCYVTAAARCAPPGNKPTARELARCRDYLEAELGLLRRVRVVMVLGRIAFGAFGRASATGKRERGKGERASGSGTGTAGRVVPQFGHGAEFRLPDGTTLLCSYHPSRQNTNTGRLTRAMWDQVFRRARALVEEAGG